MSNKTVILKDREGNNIYPKVPYTNVFGIPHPINEDINIFYGNGAPTSTQSSYENVKVDDLYIDRNKTYALCIYRCVAIPTTGVVVWRATESDIKNAGSPTTQGSSFYVSFSMDLKIGITYTDTNTGYVYLLTEINGNNLTWTKINEDELPESTSSDARKVLTVDQNGDPSWENKEPRYELLGTYDMSQNPTGFTFDATDNVDDFLIVCENILSTENSKRLAFRMPMDSISISPTTEYALSDITPKNFYIKHERINENLYETMLCGDLLAATRNVQIYNYSNTTSYSSKLKRIQVSVGSGAGSAIASGTIKIYGRIKF